MENSRSILFPKLLAYTTFEILAWEQWEILDETRDDHSF